ncbi:hypothetical protein AURDEDRAFT_188434 [Auricularia subglabra TFB-10046 SS5]|uniref:F-box domain-containing protein n=1 Tax=Auricularia subglabra (strain TFB-10046 / SS5) TaxID=717982 RepID=J0CYB3_AURST|nr:hypothetical protein AURDEDRAFT_188434 [Auricularia subglabra TFB-10046 SS5]
MMLPFSASLKLVEQQGLVFLGAGPCLVHGQVQVSLPFARPLGDIVIRHVVRYTLNIPGHKIEQGELQSTETRITLPQALSSGRKSLAWSLQLPSDTPATVKCSRGSIRHSIEVSTTSTSTEIRDAKELRVVKMPSSETNEDHWRRRLLGVLDDLGVRTSDLLMKHSEEYPKPYAVTLTAPQLMVGGPLDFHLDLPSVREDVHVHTVSVHVNERTALISPSDAKRTYVTNLEYLVLHLDTSTLQSSSSSSSSSQDQSHRLAAARMTGLSAAPPLARGLEFERLSRLPTDGAVQPSLSSSTSPICVSHDLVIAVKYSVGSSGKVRMAKMSAAVDLASLVIFPTRSSFPVCTLLQTRDQIRVALWSMQDLPGDILFRIFDELPLSSIIRSSHVSRIWRALALGHPKFCRDIEFRHLEEVAPSNSVAGLLVARAQSATGIVNLHLHVSHPSGFVEAALLPLVSQCMHRAVDLHVMVHPSFAAQLVRAVSYPAPQLERLRLDLHDPQTKLTILELHPDFLAGAAPRLTTFHTRGFSCTPGSSAIPALASVKTLIYGPLHYAPAQDFSFFIRMLKCFPRLECLRLSGQRWTGSWGNFALRPPPHTVDLNSVSPVSSEVLNALATPNTKIITTPGSYLRGDDFSFLAAQLTGPLTLEIHLPPNANMYYVRLRDEHGRVRQMNYIDLSYAGYWESEVPGNLVGSFTPLVWRITHIAVRSELWENLLMLAPELPAVTHVTVYVDGASAAGNGAALAPVACPALCVVEISSNNGGSVGVTWLAGLLGHTLGARARRRLSLVLDGCNIEGDPNLIWGYFADVSLVPHDAR